MGSGVFGQHSAYFRPRVRLRFTTQTPLANEDLLASTP